MIGTPRTETIENNTPSQAQGSGALERQTTTDGATGIKTDAKKNTVRAVEQRNVTHDGHKYDTYQREQAQTPREAGQQHHMAKEKQ